MSINNQHTSAGFIYPMAILLFGREFTRGERPDSLGAEEVVACHQFATIHTKPRDADPSHPSAVGFDRTISRDAWATTDCNSSLSLGSVPRRGTAALVSPYCRLLQTVSCNGRLRRTSSMASFEVIQPISHSPVNLHLVPRSTCHYPVSSQ